MTLTPFFAARVIGVILFGAVFFHLWAMPWGLIAAAGLACVVLP